MNVKSIEFQIETLFRDYDESLANVYAAGAMSARESLIKIANSCPALKSGIMTRLEKRAA